MADVTRLMTRPVTLIHRVVDGSDTYGQPIYSDALQPAKGYAYQKRTGDRDAGTGTITVTWENLWLVLPADTTLTSIDAVRIDGVDYEVVGNPHPNWNPRLERVEFVEIELRRAAA